jgi:hypothetical protein
MAKVYLTILSLLIALNVHGQIDFRKGFIIDLANDTTWGYVNFKATDLAYKQCSFKENLEAESKRYSANEIQGYGILNERIYHAKEFTLKDQLPQTSFLEVLVDGAITLYKFESRYLLLKGDRIYELYNQEKEVTINHKKYIRKSTEYLGTLKLLLQDCPEIENEYQNMRLHEKKLTKLITKYNTQKGSKSGLTFREEKNWFAMSYELHVGLTNSHIITQARHINRNFRGKFNSSTQPMVGLNLDFTIPRKTDHISLSLGAHFITQQYENTANTNKIELKAKKLNIPIGVRYYYPINKTIPYFTLGVSGGLAFNTSSRSFTNTPHKSQEIDFFYKRTIGISGGIGARRPLTKKVELMMELRIERGDDNNFQFDRSNHLRQFTTTSLQFSTGIRFK